MTHVKRYLVIGMRIPDHLDPENFPALRRRLATRMAEVSDTPVEANLSVARELIVRTYSAGHRVVFAGIEIPRVVH